MTDRRYARRIESEFPPMLRAFLASIPADGWTGSRLDLWLAFDKHLTPHGIHPGPKELVREIQWRPELLREAGVTMRRKRTATGILFVFTRVKRKTPVPTPDAAPAIDLDALEREIDELLAELREGEDGDGADLARLADDGCPNVLEAAT